MILLGFWTAMTGWVKFPEKSEIVHYEADSECVMYGNPSWPSYSWVCFDPVKRDELIQNQIASWARSWL